VGHVPRHTDAPKAAHVTGQRTLGRARHAATLAAACCVVAGCGGQPAPSGCAAAREEATRVAARYLARTGQDPEQLEAATTASVRADLPDGGPPINVTLTCGPGGWRVREAQRSAW
jgi:hypothetical protein